VTDQERAEPSAPEADDRRPTLPSAPDPAAAVQASAAEADPAVAREFWAAVLLANVAVGGVGVGALVWLFGGGTLGAGLVLVGAVALLLTARRVRTFGRSAPDESAAPVGGAPESTPAADADAEAEADGHGAAADRDGAARRNA
jgi:hypothetical protein